MPSQPSVVALCVGRPQRVGPDDESPFGNPWTERGRDASWTSGIFKRPLEGLVALTPRGFEGDGQADTVDHGGPDKAVCAYSADHYPEWRRVLGIEPFDYGAFGENLTIAGLDERTVCVGDVWAVGEAVLQVSQPRKPCWKLSRKWQLPTLTDRVIATGRTGWYFRVLHPAPVRTGALLTLRERPHPEWTVTSANVVMYDRTGDLAALAGLDALSPAWRDTLRKRLRS